jgi:hypothetical protein
MLRSLLTRACFTLLALIFCQAQAHLLPAQNATMNIIDNAAYMVVSVPVSALEGVDNDGDGKLSLKSCSAITIPSSSSLARALKSPIAITRVKLHSTG